MGVLKDGDARASDQIVVSFSRLHRRRHSRVVLRQSDELTQQETRNLKTEHFTVRTTVSHISRVVAHVTVAQDFLPTRVTFLRRLHGVVHGLAE